MLKLVERLQFHITSASLCGIRSWRRPSNSNPQTKTNNTPGDSKSWKNPLVLGVYLFFSENDGFWRQTPETLTIHCFFVFGKAIGSPGCFSMSEGWGEQSESCHRNRWKLPAKLPQFSAKLLQNSRKCPQNSRKYPQNSRKYPQKSANPKMTES